MYYIRKHDKATNTWPILGETLDPKGLTAGQNVYSRTEAEKIVADNPDETYNYYKALTMSYRVTGIDKNNNHLDLCKAMSGFGWKRGTGYHFTGIGTAIFNAIDTNKESQIVTIKVYKVSASNPVVSFDIQNVDFEKHCVD